MSPNHTHFISPSIKQSPFMTTIAGPPLLSTLNAPIQRAVSVQDMGHAGSVPEREWESRVTPVCPGPVRGSSSHRANSHSSGKQNLNRRSRHLPLKPKAAELGAACSNSPACRSLRPGRHGGVETGHWLDEWEERHESRRG